MRQQVHHRENGRQTGSSSARYRRPGGSEAAIHALRRYAEVLPKDHIIVKQDFTNAFNTLCRDELLDAIWREIPEIYNFAHATYNGSQ